MKFAQLLLAVSLLASSSCERVRSLISSAEKTKEPGKAATPSATLVADIAIADLNSFPRQAGKVAIVEYYAAWSGQSRQLAPLLEALTTEHAGSVVVGKVNIDTYHDFATKEGVKDIPDVRIYRDGRMVDRFVGLPDQDEIRERIAKQAAGLPPPAAPGTEPPSGKTVIKPMPKDWMPPGMTRR